MCAMPTNEQPVSGPSRPPGIRSRRASRPRRDASPRRDRRQALIDAAIEMFTEDGSADISAAAVARRADVAHGLLFYYFTDKKGLVAAALVDMLDELAAYQSPRPEEKTERERLEGFVRRHVEFLDRYRMAYLRVCSPPPRSIALYSRPVRTPRIRSLNSPAWPSPDLLAAESLSVAG